MCNPGPLEPMPVLPDVRQPALYFFPKAQTPALERMGQVRAACLPTAGNRPPMASQ